MSLRFYTPLFFLLFSLYALAQENFTVAAIPSALSENANAVVRLSRTDIEISSQKSITVKKYRAVTVFNENGLSHLDAYEYFDDDTKIKSIEAVVYNAFGQEIKKIKKKDFRMSSVTEFSVITDDKMFYLDYTPVQYPFTIVYTSEVSGSDTAFIPGWVPVGGYNVAVKKAAINIICDPQLGFRYKDYNFDTITLNKTETVNGLQLNCENIPAFKYEEYTPSDKIIPMVYFAVNKFHLKGVNGEAADWKAFGLWYNNTLLADTDELSSETVSHIQSLVSEGKSIAEKAKIIYNYVQQKTRYISIQLGIGGWKPMLAKDVDRLGYGDCKALSNYTRALLKAVGVESYYAVVYGDSDKRSIREDFTCMQGNHVILAIPAEKDMLWLECTSQTAPFDFQANFTDDRLALLIKPEGGELVHTHVYEEEENTQFSKGTYTITADGGIKGSLSIVSGGTQYASKNHLEGKSQEDLNKRYKSYFGNINNLKLKKTEIINDKKGVKFTENVSLEAQGYCSISGNRMMFVVNAFNQYNGVPQRYRTRHNPFEIERGFYDVDEVVINLPEGFDVEAMPQGVEIKDKFGEYKAEYTLISPTQLLYKRSLKTNTGLFEKDDYELFREFREKIARNDNSKIVLIKK